MADEPKNEYAEELIKAADQEIEKFYDFMINTSSNDICNTREEAVSKLRRISSVIYDMQLESLRSMPKNERLQDETDNDLWIFNHLKEWIYELDEAISLNPYFQHEIEKPEYKNLPIDELQHRVSEETDQNGIEITLWQKALFNARKLKSANNEKTAKGKTKLAKQNGVYTHIGYLLVPSNPDFKDIFTTSIKKDVGIFRKTDDGKVQLALDINVQFIQALAQLTYLQFTERENTSGEIKYHFPTLARELGFDINQKTVKENGITRAESRTLYVNKSMNELDQIWGKLPGDRTEYKLISIHSYNPETEIVSFVSPLIQQYLLRQFNEESRIIESGKPYCPQWFSALLHPDATSDRNKAAVEMATRILVGVQNRGTTPDAKLRQNKKKKLKDESCVTYTITVAGLIEQCPQIREKLHSQKTKSNQTKALQRAFSSMYRILKKKTDLYTYYDDLQIREISPNMSNLDEVITIIHHGQNPNYRRPIPLNPQPEIIKNDAI